MFKKFAVLLVCFLVAIITTGGILEASGYWASDTDKNNAMSVSEKQDFKVTKEDLELSDLIQKPVPSSNFWDKKVKVAVVYKNSNKFYRPGKNTKS